MNKGLIKTPDEIEKIAEGGKILHDILRQTAGLVKAGVTTAELNDFAEKKIHQAGGIPSFKDYGPKNNPYPAALCTSVNDVVVHGIPSSEVKLKDGDIISLDIGMEYKEMFTDTAITVPVGNVNAKAQLLLETTQEALNKALKQVKPGNRIGDISSVIQQTAESRGFSVVKDLVGHGVGYAVHEDPAVPCYGRAGTGPKLLEGMVLAVEPMVCEGSFYLTFDRDGWTIRTKDRSLAAHFEHTIAVTRKGYRILT